MSLFARSILRPRGSLLKAPLASSRLLSSQPGGVAPLDPAYTEGERTLHEKLANQLQATKLKVSDISGGCGSMYAVQIASPLFKGKPLIRQHQMVTDILREDIKGMHGIQIKTEAA
ncbi:bola protein [Fimicolochytrium jonesii]|uniref:bola protein n=1 Tax=Fimicolochytrium jonesii TaxID=1396493 RepID=UPI0022FF30F8|nr:bola protein [Fimicolochytrium jonesii]KAI8826798.1 bola protein [Fimicolochytrium jonesii]